MIKADFHIHTNEDPTHPWIKYSAKDIVDISSKKGYGALAITCHDHIFFTKDLEAYALKKGIILFPGLERTIKGKHILIINADKDAYKIKDFLDLKEYKRTRDVLIIAAHPAYLHSSIGPKCKSLTGCFDALEHSFFYSKIINPNLLTKRWSKKTKLPLFANSDCHVLKYFDRNYTLIDAKKNKLDIISAVKKGKIKIVSKPLGTLVLIRLGLSLTISTLKQIFSH